jgi:hypothetical protein
MPKTKVKQPKVPEPYWRSLVETYLLFMENKIGEPVEFEGAATRDLKSIVKFLHESGNAKRIAWTKDIACRTLSVFMQVAWGFEGVVCNSIWFVPTANKFKIEIVEMIRQFKSEKLSKQSI